MSKKSNLAITVKGAIKLYERLLSLGTIAENGAAHKRLEVLREANRKRRYPQKGKK
tara:strand:- start:1606 stop:1773 length:168 start_codon:yes stop_codon:yes gene_type:complete